MSSSATRNSGYTHGLAQPRCSERQLRPAVSKGRRNTLVFFERWSVRDEVSHTDVLHGQAEVRDVGSVAARRVDEFDWKAF